MKKFLRTHLLLALLFIFFSCDSHGSNPQGNNDNDDLMNFLVSSGFTASELQINENEIIYQNDIILDRNFIEQEMKNRKKQRKHWWLVSSGNISNIYIKIESSVPWSWRTAIESAVSEWNAVSGTSVHMYIIASGSPDITVKYQNIGASHILADAKMPAWNNVGNRIRINSSGSATTWSEKKNAMAHELGHTIGLHHTNQTKGFHISGTPSSDPSSVMHSSNSSWSGFTTGDKDAVRILYP